MIKVRPINCSQCGATIDMTKIVNTGISDVFKCEYCGAMLEIVNYKVHGSIADYNTTKYGIPANSEVSVGVRRWSLEEHERASGVGGATKIFYYLFIAGVIISLFFLPDAWRQATVKEGMSKAGLLWIIMIFDSFAVPMVFIWGIMLHGAKQQYERNQ